MSYTNQQTTNFADLISKLNTFLSGTPGWTTHHVPASGEFAARKTPGGNDIGFASQWDTGTPLRLGIYQFHGGVYSAIDSPWDQIDDSGNGFAGTAIPENSRHAHITDSPIQFWCFEDDDYFNVMVEYTSGRFSSFGAGLIDKFNDFTGGEYVYGWWQDQIFSGNQAVIGNSTMFLDGLAVDTSPGFNNQEERVATMRIEGFDDQAGTSKYAVVMGGQATANLGTDRQGPAGGPKTNEPRVNVIGGFRGGPIAFPFGEGLRGTKTKGNCPMHPIVQFYWNRTTGDIYGPLGQMKDVRGINNRDFDAGEEVVLGSDTWVVFPTARKATADTQSGVGYSLFQGVAFKKVTT